MNIILGKTAGFCGGVKNAVTKAQKYIENSENREIYCLGELVHNKQVIDNLKNKGVKFIDNLDEINIDDGREKSVIIRAHGAEKKVYEEIKQRNSEILDLSCPNVLAIHKIVEEYTKKGFYTIILGEKKHPETIGTYSYTDGKGVIIEEKEEIKAKIDKIKKEFVDKILIIAQTTFSMEKFNQFVNLIKAMFNENDGSANVEIEVRNTICNATKLRQEETKEIAEKVDYMIIIGGKNSANTQKLYEIAKSACKHVTFVENCKELIEDKKNEVMQIKEYTNIGVMAGASTPKESIDEVINLLQFTQNSQKFGYELIDKK